jgi:hypothetical protein
MFICLQDISVVRARIQDVARLPVRLPIVNRSVSFVLALMLLAGEFAYSTTVQRLELEELVKKAHHIVVGKVRNSTTHWSNNGKLILTDYAVEVEENIKGQSSRLLQVTTIGGKIGDLELNVSGMPSFQKDESVLLFTESSGSYEVVLGLGQGKFHLENGEVFNDVAALSFPDGRPGNAVKLPIETFKNRIRRILAQ